MACCAGSGQGRVWPERGTRANPNPTLSQARSRFTRPPTVRGFTGSCRRSLGYSQRMGLHLVAAPGGHHRAAAEAIHHTLRSTTKTDGSEAREVRQNVGLGLTITRNPAWRRLSRGPRHRDGSASALSTSEARASESRSMTSLASWLILVAVWTLAINEPSWSRCKRWPTSKTSPGSLWACRSTSAATRGQPPAGRAGWRKESQMRRAARSSCGMSA
jgi:hypothetical protein